MDIKMLLNSLNSKVSSHSYFETKVYHDEPIIRTAAQMEGFLPEQYKRMKRLATDSSATKKNESQIFYEQAALMEKFEDDYFCADEFRCYFPTYSSMNDKQLRHYFSWRSEVRRGVAEETSLSYVYVYLYELLQLIGTKGPSHAYAKILGFYKAYRTIDIRLDAYVPLWLKDMVVYYNLDASLLNGIYDDSTEIAVLTLINNENDDEKLFCAIESLSAYKFSGSSFCKQNLSDFKAVTIKVFRELYGFYERKRNGSFAEMLFGRRVKCPYHIFDSAVFFRNSTITDYTYTLNPIHVYRCKNGNWSCERYFGNLKNNKQIGNILKYIDYLMRTVTNFRHLLKADDISCGNKKMLERIVRSFYEEKVKAQIPIVQIDTQKLSLIRDNAEVICEKLIVEEVEEVIEEPSEEETGILTSKEKAFMRILLNGESCSKFLKENNLMISLIIDSINEKLFDEFADTVILCDGDSPEIYEDYIEELKGMFI